MRFLALILFLPWFAILAWAYWAWPRWLPRSAARRGFDLAVLALAALASAIAMDTAYDANGGFGGTLWKQVIATLCAYAGFLGVVAAAFFVRGRVWRHVNRPSG